MSNQSYSAKITGTGSYHPPRKVTNYDLEKMMDTSHEWIVQRSGIETRYFADKDTSTSDLAFEASKKALLSAGLEAKDLDLIITATLSPDHQFPGIGVKLQHKLGLSTTPAMDIRNQCSGFIYAMNTAKLFVASGQYKRVLVVGAEIHSKIVDLSTRGRDISVLFGDGAGAVIVEASKDDSADLLGFRLHSQGEFCDSLWLERPGTAKEFYIEREDLEAGRHYPYMEGRNVFKHATKRLQETIGELIEQNSIALDQIDHFLFHQANIRINEAVAKRLEIPESKVHNNIQKYGNCSAASLPILLDECLKEGKIKRGDLLCLAAFGAGFTWGGCLVRF